jgi:rod shape-determining protein MreC
MDTLISRYRSILVLMLVLLAQLVLLGYQVKSDKDVRLIRVWAVTAVTPLAVTIESVRSAVSRTFGDFFTFRDARSENRKLREELGRLKMENQYLRTELATADRARALSAFQARNQSRTVAARVIGTSPGANAKVVYVDRGSVTAGIQKGMAVVTPDGIVGKVVSVYPTASMVQLITDAGFAAGVISQKNRVRGIVRGQEVNCRVDYVQNEDNVDPGEWFFTSGDDRVFPKGIPVGQAKIVAQGPQFKKIVLEPSGFQSGLEEVLIVMEAVHGQIPDVPAEATGVYVAPPPPGEGAAEGETPRPGSGTEADRLLDKYKAIGDSQGHKFGEGTPGARAVDFNAPVTQPAATSTQPAGSPTQPGTSPTQPAATAPPTTGGQPAPPTAEAKPEAAPPRSATNATTPSPSPERRR